MPMFLMLKPRRTAVVPIAAILNLSPRSLPQQTINSPHMPKTPWPVFHHIWATTTHLTSLRLPCPPSIHFRRISHRSAMGLSLQLQCPKLHCPPSCNHQPTSQRSPRRESKNTLTDGSKCSMGPRMLSEDWFWSRTPSPVHTLLRSQSMKAFTKYLQVSATSMALFLNPVHPHLLQWNHNCTS